MHWTPVIICVYALHWTMVSTCKDKRRIFLLNVIDIIFSLRDIKSEQYSGDNHYVFCFLFISTNQSTIHLVKHYIARPQNVLLPLFSEYFMSGCFIEQTL